MNFTFNLLTEPWIPVLQNDGKIRDVGLRELLLDAHNFREIAHDSPPFVASLLMVGVALLHSAWPGETTIEREDEWERVWNLGRFDADVLEAYFQKWADRFDLFHPQFPFYQTAGMTMEKDSALFRLALDENNAGMFANEANPEWQAPSPQIAAQLLLCIQSYAVGLGLTSNAKIGAEVLETPRFTNGVLMSGLTIWPSGATLFQTLMLNTVPHERAEDDKPCWELDAPHLLRDTESKAGRRVEPVRGICDLLTLQSRLIRLLPVERNGQVAVPSVYFTQGRSVSRSGGTEFHPFKLYIPSKETGFTPLSLSENKAIWRNSAALLSPETRKHDARNPLSFVAQMAQGGVLAPDFRAGLDVVGIATKPGKAASILLWRHDRLPLPPALLLDRNVESRVHAAIDEADKLADEMRLRFSMVARTLLVPEKMAGHSPDPDDVKNLVAKFDPRRAFWPQLETPFLDFLKRLPTEPDAARSDWRTAIEMTANECFGAACNALGTGPDAVVAVAQVSRFFKLEHILERAEKFKSSRPKTAKKR